MKQLLKHCAGSLLDRIAPALGEEVEMGDLSGKNAKLKELIADSRTRQAAQAGNHHHLRRHLSNYWRSDRGDQFYDAYPERFENWFLGEHYALVEALEAQLRERPRIRQLIEVGCGDGRVLAHLAEKFPQFRSAVGIDLNPRIIKRNTEIYQDSSLKFLSADLFDWLRETQPSDFLLLSYGGVLEYLTEDELRELFSWMKDSSAPALLALVEPIAPDFNLDAEDSSRPHGIENSFSHPHRKLLLECGWKIEFEEVKEMEHRWMLMIASLETSGKST